MMNQEITNYKSQKAVKEVEYAFISNLQGQDVLFIKPDGLNPVAYRLPQGFIKKLQASLVDKTEPKALFSLGQTFITPGAAGALQDSHQTANEFLTRHHLGDWGDVNKADWKENDFSVKEGFRIFSAYETNKGEKLWVITESCRSSTTVLLPSEY